MVTVLVVGKVTLLRGSSTNTFTSMKNQMTSGAFLLCVEVFSSSKTQDILAHEQQAKHVTLLSVLTSLRHHANTEKRRVRCTFTS